MVPFSGVASAEMPMLLRDFQLCSQEQPRLNSTVNKGKSGRKANVVLALWLRMLPS